MESRFSGGKNLHSLTKRQEQIAGLIACGMAKKEVADKLNITISTVDATLRPIYLKTGCQKINELTGWYFNTHYSLDIDFGKLKNELSLLNK